MKAWITAPFNDNGVEEIEVFGEPSDACLRFRRRNGGGVSEAYNWYKEGVSWHRSYGAAVEVARKLRAKRIEIAAGEVARIAALPPIPDLQ